MKPVEQKDLPKIKFIDQPESFGARVVGEVYQQVSPFQWLERDWNNDGDVYEQKVAGFQRLTRINPHTNNYFCISEGDFNDLKNYGCIEYVQEHLQIVDSVALDGQSMMYTVSLAQGFAVDIKVCADTGLVYAMQNADGSTVHSDTSAEETFPEFAYDEEASVRLVKAAHAKRKPSLGVVIRNCEEMRKTRLNDDVNRKGTVDKER